MFKISQIVDTTFGAFLCPVKILYIYPLSTNKPFFSVTASSSHFWDLPFRKSSVFMHKPNGLNLDKFLKIPHLSVLFIDKYGFAYYTESTTNHDKYGTPYLLRCNYSTESRTLSSKKLRVSVFLWEYTKREVRNWVHYTKTLSLCAVSVELKGGRCVQI